MLDASSWALIGTLAFSVIGIAGAAVAMINARSARNLLCDVFDSVPSPRQLIDARGRVIYSNPSYRERFGSAEPPAPEALIARLDGNTEAVDLLERLRDDVRRGIGGNIEFPVPAREGQEETWYQVSAYPLVRRKGMTFWYINDITLRRQMEQVINEEQARFIDLMEHAPIGFFSSDPEGRLLFVNQSFAAWLGTTREALMKGEIRLHDLLAAPPPEHTPPYAVVPESESRDSVEVVIKPVEGAAFEAAISLETVKDLDGKLLRLRSVVRHLTRERQTAEALAQSERRIARLFEAAPMGLALLDSEGRILEYNRSFAAMARPSGKLRKRQAFAELFSEADRPALQQALQELAKDDDARAAAAAPGGDRQARQDMVKAPIELRFLGDPPKVAALSLSWSESLDDQQEGYVAYLEDVTEQKSLEAQFVQGQKMQAVGQLAGGIAHDFNNLLTAMIGFSDLLLLRHRPGDQSFADIMQIKQNANRAANLVRQLLAFSRQQTLQPKVLDVTDALAELSHLLRRLIGDTVELQLVHGRDLGLVRVDHGQLEQVIINLAVNARDAMPEGGRLVIKTSNVTLATSLRHKDELVPAGDYVVIEVIDSGNGIAPEHIDRVFDPFFSTKDVGEGTGLGLSTVYGIVKQTGGHIYVESRDGEGTTFSIYLPQHQSSEDELAGKAQPELAEKRDLTGIGTVLLVEDEDAVRTFSARALRNKGYDVLEARSGEAALEVLDNGAAEPALPGGGGGPRAIDLLITDIVMPRIDGVTLVRRVRESYPEMKVIFISGYAEDAFRQRLDQIDGTHFLSKPFSLKDLASKVKEVLSEPDT